MGYMAGARCARSLARSRDTHTRTYEWRSRWPAFLLRATRERVSLGMQRAPIRRYGAAHAVVERPFEGQGSRLSERRYIYATRPLAFTTFTVQPSTPMRARRVSRAARPSPAAPVGAARSRVHACPRERASGPRNSYPLLGIDR